MIACSIAVSLASAAKKTYKTDTLISLEQEKERYLKNKQEVPEELLKKIEFEKQFSIIEQQNQEKCEKEVEELKKQREMEQKENSRMGIKIRKIQALY